MKFREKFYCEASGLSHKRELLRIHPTHSSVTRLKISSRRSEMSRTSPDVAVLKGVVNIASNLEEIPSYAAISGSIKSVYAQAKPKDWGENIHLQTLITLFYMNVHFLNKHKLKTLKSCNTIAHECLKRITLFKKRFLKTNNQKSLSCFKAF